MFLPTFVCNNKCLRLYSKQKDILENGIFIKNLNYFVGFFRPKGARVAEDRKDWRNLTEPDGPTTVLVNLFVRSFEKIDDVKMEFSVQITFRQQWNDNR